MIDCYGAEVVQTYMSYVRSNAEVAVRSLLKEVAAKTATNVLEAQDFMDDGTPIHLKVVIDPQQGSAIFDFTLVRVEDSLSKSSVNLRMNLAGPVLKSGATPTHHEPSLYLPLFTACGAWWATTSR